VGGVWGVVDGAVPGECRGGAVGDMGENASDLVVFGVGHLASSSPPFSSSLFSSLLSSLLSSFLSSLLSSLFSALAGASLSPGSLSASPPRLRFSSSVLPTLSWPPFSFLSSSSSLASSSSSSSPSSSPYPSSTSFPRTHCRSLPYGTGFGFHRDGLPYSGGLLGAPRAYWIWIHRLG